VEKDGRWKKRRGGTVNSAGEKQRRRETSLTDVVPNVVPSMGVARWQGRPVLCRDIQRLVTTSSSRRRKRESSWWHGEFNLFRSIKVSKVYRLHWSASALFPLQMTPRWRVAENIRLVYSSYCPRSTPSGATETKDIKTSRSVSQLKCVKS
jgi:hypothetical protein